MLTVSAQEAKRLSTPTSSTRCEHAATDDFLESGVLVAQGVSFPLNGHEMR